MNRTQGVHRRIGLGVSLFVLGISSVAFAARMEGVRVSDTPHRIEIRLDEKPKWRVFQTSGNEVLLALSDTDVADDFARSGSAKAFRKMTFQAGDAKIGRVRIETRNPVLKVTGSWDDSVRLLTLDFRFKGDGARSEAGADLRRIFEKKPAWTRAKRPLDASDAENGDGASSSAPEAADPSSGREGERAPVPDGHDGFDRMLKDVMESGCRGSAHLRVAARQMMEGTFDAAEQTLEKGRPLMRTPECRELFTVMERTLDWRRVEDDPEADLVALGRILEEDLGSLETPVARPWVMALLAVVHHRLQNDPLSLGYCDMVRETAPTAPIMADVGALSGQIHLGQGKLARAEEELREVVKHHPDSPASQDCRVELSRLMFRKKRYFDALNLVGSVLEREPERALESPDLLALVGNSHFETGASREALETLLQAVNCFPEIENRDLLMTRIAESYAHLEDMKRARDLFNLVIALYPGSDGYVRATMRLAEMNSDREAAEAGFRTILEHYPDHDMARLARIRLAASRLAAGDAEGCVTEIEPLFSQDPRGLRKEALGLMEEALTTIFDRDIAHGRYAAVLSRYDAHKRWILEMESADLQAKIGEAFLESRLWKPAKYHLTLAARLGGRKGLSGKSLYHLAVAAQETGEYDRAEKGFRQYLAHARKDSDLKSFAWSRIARIRERRQDPDGAISAFRRAADETRRQQDKAILLRAAARITPKEPNRAFLLERAVGVADKDESKMKFDLFRELGDARVRQKQYDEASEAYESAIESGTDPQDVRAVRFALANAYVKSGRLDDARKILERLVATEDPLWASLARERLVALSVEGRLQTS